MDFDDPEFGIKRISKVGRGKSTSPSSYYDLGSIAAQECTNGSTAPHRFYAAVASGVWLEKNFDNLPNVLNLPLEECVVKLEEALGFGWGHITVMHFLTDVGVCCKPDIHLIAAVKEIGIFDDQRNPQTSRPAAIAVNAAVGNLVEKIYEEITPQRLRYTDKVLMEISRKLLNKPEQDEVG